MKVEQLFACNHVSEERKVPLATLSFQGNAMYWWTALDRDKLLQRLQQKTMSVEEYKQKMELYMMRASIREFEPTTIARFLSGLNLEIRDRVELLPYRNLNDLIQLCIKVEQQNLRKGSSRKESSYSNSYPKEEYKKEESLSKEKQKETPKNIEKDVLTPQTRSRDVKCFKCYGRGHVQA